MKLYGTPPQPRSATQTEIAGQWAGLIAKDVWQEALCSLWTEFTQTGVQQTHAGAGASPGLRFVAWPKG